MPRRDIRYLNGHLPQPGRYFWFMHRLARRVWPWFGSLAVEGKQHVPLTGPFLLISNHQSVLDPFFIETFIDRPVHQMAKSTQFASPLFARAMRGCYAYPVRRFQVDPTAVRYTLRRLAEGDPVHIYIEGERTWDGTLQPPRPGTVRIALKAGVPIVPCAIDGSYDVWPRWDRAARAADVRVAFGKPFLLPQLHHRTDRERALPHAADRIMGAIAALLGVPPTRLADD
ncbi:MAG TPA: lysophospholipid acyltransferase family protein [Longimicrobiales bacterium]|nr:lysophospholipid acyltransferase family protein [Longimicrobiales bacterium]